MLGNAILHGDTGPDAEVRLYVEKRPKLVRVVVSGRGRGFVAHYEKQDRVGGAGLALIQAVSSRFGVTRAQGQTQAWPNSTCPNRSDTADQQAVIIAVGKGRACDG